MRISDAVTFRSDALFHGAVQISWFESDPEIAALAASRFVFHGPDYHGVKSNDISGAGQHRLVDTATLTRDIFCHFAADCSDENPFILAIAGWGTGKSHLGLTVAKMASAPQSDPCLDALKSLAAASPELAASVRDTLEETPQPLLTVSINGMQDFSLAEEVSRQILTQVRKAGASPESLESLRPRFITASKFVERNFDLRKNSFQKAWHPGVTGAEIIDELSQQSESVYQRVEAIYQEANGSPIPVTSQESLQQLVDVVCRDYCGPDKPFRGLLVIFDEFGRYLEFAVQKPHIAGSAALQQLFEAIQAHSDEALLLCFIQYELKAYASRVAPELRTELNRFIGRFDAARKYYLSTNLETLLAHLLEPWDKDQFSEEFRNQHSAADLEAVQGECLRRFPGMDRHSQWADTDRFSRVIAEGCWPLHPTATWVLYYLSADGKSLQQRSAMSLLDEALGSIADREVESGLPASISAVDLCIDSMITEFVASEQFGAAGSAAMAYEAVRGRYKHDLTQEHDRTLRAIVIAQKVGLRAESREDAISGLAGLAGMEESLLQDATESLSSDLGALEWDAHRNRFEILGDAVPRAQFVAFLGRKVDEVTQSQRAQLFALNGLKQCDVPECNTDFDQEHTISTPEWWFERTCTTVDHIEQEIQQAVIDLTDGCAVDSARGRTIYCYLGSQSDLEAVEAMVRRSIASSISDTYWQTSGLPILVILMQDAEGSLGESLAELHVLKTGISEDEQGKYGLFLEQARSEAMDKAKALAARLIRDRRYVTCDRVELPDGRLRQTLGAVFEQCFPAAVSFPFDGFGTARGNAAKDARAVMAELLKGTFSEEWVATQIVRVRNRVGRLLSDEWQCLSPQYMVLSEPLHVEVATAINALDKMVEQGDRLDLSEAILVLCRPPYGCNIASAGLLLAVYFAARRNRFVFQLQGQQLTMAELLEVALPKNFLELKVLRNAAAFRVTADQEQVWQEKLTEWDATTTHSGRLECRMQCELFKGQTPLPDHLCDRYQLLEERTAQSARQLRSLHDLLDKQAHFVEVALPRHDVKGLSRSASELLAKLRAMAHETGRWMPNETEAVQERLDEIKEGILSSFDRWVVGEQIIRPEQIPDYRRLCMEKIPETLENLGLQQFANKLKDHARNAIRSVERFERYKHIVDEAKAMVRSHRVAPNTALGEATEWMANAEDVYKHLQKAYDATTAHEVLEALKAVEAFIGKCGKQRETLRERGKAFWRRSPSSSAELSEALDEVDELVRLFAGAESDLNDFRCIRDQLRILTENERRLAHDTHLDKDGLLQLATEMTAGFDERWDENEDAVPWRAADVHGFLCREVIAQREQDAQEWLAKAVPTPKAIKEMIAGNAAKALSYLSPRPAFLGLKGETKVDKAEQSLRGRLLALDVEGLLAQFRRLSPTAREDFLKKATAITKGRANSPAGQ